MKYRIEESLELNICLEILFSSLPKDRSKIMPKHSIDKIKIFDYFSKKLKITSYKVFRRRMNYKLFGVNVISNREELCLENENNFLWLIDFRCKNDISFDYYTYNVKNFPRIFKEAIIDTCIELNESVLVHTNIPKSSQSVVFIPKASSLEELAIKMELEA